MPATIIDVNAVEEGTSRALGFVSEQEDSLAAIDQIIMNMEDAWESESQRAYAQSFRASRDRIANFTQSVNDSIKEMRNFVTDCVDADELTAREIRSVSW